LRIAARLRLDQRGQIIEQLVSVWLSGLQPPPGLRTRSASCAPRAFGQSAPNDAERDPSPRLAVVASAAAKRRRSHWSSTGASASNRKWMAD
jgi:hypothetical protein